MLAQINIFKDNIYTYLLKNIDVAKETIGNNNLAACSNFPMPHGNGSMQNNFNLRVVLSVYIKLHANSGAIEAGPTMQLIFLKQPIKCFF